MQNLVQKVVSTQQIFPVRKFHCEFEKESTADILGRPLDFCTLLCSGIVRGLASLQIGYPIVATCHCFHMLVSNLLMKKSTPFPFTTLGVIFYVAFTQNLACETQFK